MMRRISIPLSLIVVAMLSWTTLSTAAIPTPKCTVASSRALDRDPVEVSTRTCTQQLPANRVAITARATVRGKWGKVTRYRAKVVRRGKLRVTRVSLVRATERAAIRAYKRKYG